MCAPVSPDDHLDQTVSAFDLAEARGDLIRALEFHEALTVQIAINGETGSSLRAAGITIPTPCAPPS